MFSTRLQSKFDNSRKRNDILRMNIIGVVALFGTIDGIIRNNAVLLFGIEGIIQFKSASEYIKKKRVPISDPKILLSNKTRFLKMKRATRLSHVAVH